MSALSPGQHVSHYRILRPLGAGGMGEVYLAEDAKLGRQVALKVLAHESARDPDRRARFEREARAVAALNHPGIVTIHSVEEADGLLFITMELVEGKTLSEGIPAAGMPLDQLLKVAIPLADAVGTAHQRGITHRDLKPANVMVSDDGRVKVLDFGLAKLHLQEALQTETALAPAAHMTGAGKIVGTVAYMSPEQAQGKPVDQRSDIFSLGIVLFEMATGERPFTGDSNVAVVSSLLKDTPPLVCDVRLGLPRELGRIIERCLEKDPEERYQSAKDLRNDLKALKADSDSGEPARGATAVVTAAGTAAVDASRTAARVGDRIWVWAAAALVAITGGGIAWWMSLPPPRPRVNATRQITTDGVQKIGQPVTDGTRLYFTVAIFEGREFVLVQVSVSGGETVLLAHDNPGILDIDPSGTELLVGAGGDLSIMPIVGGPKRRVGDARTSTFPFGGATWTPDKSRIIYSSGTQLRIVNGDGTNSRPLLTTRGVPYAPRVSPDATKVRFSVRDDSTGGSSSTLWEANYDGSNAHPLLPGWTGAPQACCGTWTPDGRYYLFEAEGNIWAIAERHGVFDRRPVDPVQLTVGPLRFTGVTPSRDSKTLFAVGNLSKGRLVRFDGKTRQFVSYLGGLSAEGVVVSPDKQWVAYTAYPEGTLWRSRVDGSERMALTSAPARAALPRWSPDGTQIAYVGWAGSASDPASTAQIYVGRAAGGQPRRVTQGPASHGDPCWLSDGKRIVFGTEARIDVMDVAAGTIETLPGSQHYFSPRCSPDGRYIAAVSVESDRLVIFDTRSGARTDLVQSLPGGVTWPNWSPDSQALSYFQGTVIRRVHIADRRVEMIVDARDMDVAIGAVGQWTGVDPDGSPIFLLNAGTHDIYALDWEAP